MSIISELRKYRKNIASKRIAKHIEKLLGDINIKSGDVILDCGANVGNVTTYFARCDAEVYAFEPNPWAFQILEARFRNAANVHCLNCAVFDSYGTMPLYLHERSGEDQVLWSSGSSLIGSKNNVKSDVSVEVPVIDLADWIARLQKPIKLIKMDIEGAEYRTILHLFETRTISVVDHMLVETHHEKYTEFAAQFTALQQKLATDEADIRFTWY